MFLKIVVILLGLWILYEILGFAFDMAKIKKSLKKFDNKK